MSIKLVLSFRGVFVVASVLCALGIASFAFSGRIMPTMLTDMLVSKAAAAESRPKPEKQTGGVKRKMSAAITPFFSSFGASPDGLVFGQGDLPLFGFQHLRTDKIYRFVGSTPIDLGSVNDFEPSWSPDGKKIVFVSLRDGPNPVQYQARQEYREIYTMNADGTDQRRHFGSQIGGEYQPSYSFHTSPPLQRIVYVGHYGNLTSLYTMDVNGSNHTYLTDAADCEVPPELARGRARKQEFYPGAVSIDTPNYSPDNQFIIFGLGGDDGINVYRINADGTGCTRLYTGQDNSYIAAEARYSPDGTKIALHHRDGNGIYNDTLRIISATTGAVLQDLIPIDGEANGHYSGSHAWDPNGSATIAYAAGDMNPKNTLEDQEIWTIDLNTAFQTQHLVQGVREGIRGIDWGVPSTVVPPLSMRINAPHPLTSGRSTTGTLYLATPAPAGGVNITLQALGATGPPPAITVPSSLFIAEGLSQADFTIDSAVNTSYRGAGVLATRPAPDFAQSQASVSLWPSRPDLRAVSFTSPPTAAPNESFNVSWTVDNIGPVTTGPNGGADAVYFSADNILDASDRLLVTLSNGALLPGASRNRNTSTSIPGSAVPSSGQYYLIFRTNPDEAVSEAGATTNNEIAVPVELSLPDLVSENVIVPPNVEPGVPYNVTWTVRNAGTATSAVASTTNVYFSGDNVAGNADDVLLNSFSTPVLAVGATSNQNVSVNIPTVPVRPSGLSFFYVKVDSGNTVGEGLATGNGETNNNNFQPTTFDYRVADMQVTATSIPPSVDTGIAFQISWTTTNAGTRAAGAFSESVYFSTDNIINANDVLLGGWNRTGLDAGANLNSTESVTIPPSAISASGSYFVYVRTDWGADVDEGVNENNNTRFQVAQVVYRIPDLQVTATGVAPEVETDTAFPVSWTSANTGTLNAGGFSERVYFSPDNLVNANDVLLGTFALPGGIAQGQSVNRVQDVTIPTSAITVTGDYFVYVRTDSGAQVHEGAGENNNTRFQPVRVRRLLRPDLTVTNVTGPPTAFFDQTVQVQWTVTNTGPGPTNAPQWRDTLYIGTNPASTSGASFLAHAQSVTALNPGESYTASVTVKVPRGLNGGYHFIVVTDSASDVNEENNGNNLRSNPIQVNVPPLPDLTVESVQAPDETFAGQEISINYTIRNVGTENAGSRKDRIYFSRDTVLNLGEDRLVFTSDNLSGPQAGAATSHVSQNRVGNDNPPVYQLGRVPSDMEGLWYVFVLTDYQDSVYEFTNENNNTGRDTVEPGSPINVLVTPPDLVVPNALTAPATAESGTSFPVTFTVRNQGAFDAGPFLYHAVYLSTDDTFSPATDRLVGSIRDPDPFGPAAEHPFTINASLPNCLANGTYYLFAVADYNGRQFEFDPNFDAEANNASPARAIQLSTVPPDLQVTNFQVPPITMPGQSVSVSWTVSNPGGTATAQRWYDQIRLHSTNPAVGAQTLATIERTGGLAAGGSYTVSRSVGMPAFMEGEYYLSVTTDYSDYAAECGTSESNNSTNSGNFTVANNLPDLVIDSVTAPPTAAVGDSFNVEWTARNANQAMPANNPSWNDTVYLSTNTTLSNSDYNLGSVISSTPLAGGETYSRQRTVQTGNVPAGTYYILVYADSGSDVYEGPGNSSFEQNNLRASGTITLTSPAVDLQVGNVAVSTPHHSGTFRNISWTVTNLGTNPTLTASWYDHVILSRDSVLDASDTTLGYTHRTTSLAAGASYTQSTNFFIPTGLTGDYSVFVITDRSDYVVENNNTNNTSAPYGVTLTLPPPAEMSVSSITPPPAINLGESANFSWTVQNASPVAVNGRWRDTVYLSRDMFWDASDILAGVSDHDSLTTPLPGAGSYTKTTNFVVPPVEEGPYYVIVRTDAQNRIRETNEGDNVTASSAITNVSITQLTLGTPFSTTLGNGAEKFFKYTTPPLETLLVTLDTDRPERSNELFTNFGTVVSRADYDFQGQRPGEGEQENFVAETNDGDYYSLVRHDRIPESFAKNFNAVSGKAKEVNAENLGSVPAQNITVNARILPFTVRGVAPEEAGNAGFITLSVDGAKFQTGATLKLVGTGGAQIVPANFRVLPTNILAVFDLRGKSAGVYDVVVRNPDNQTSTIDDGFTIINGGGAAEPRVSIEGPRFSRGGRSRYTFSFTNDGLNDSYLVPLIIVMPSRYGYELDRSNYMGDLEDMLPPDAIPSQLPLHFERDGLRVIALFTPLLASKQTVRVNIDVTLPFGFSGFEVGAMALPPFADWLRLSRQEQTESMARQSITMLGSGTEEACAAARNSCLLELLRGVLFSVLSEALPGGCLNVAWGALAAGLDLTFSIIANAAQAGDFSVAGAIGSVASFFAATLGGLATECLSVGLPWIKLISIALFTIKGLLDLYECHRAYNECLPPPPEIQETEFLAAIDPNEMLGPKGYGGEGFVPIRQPLTYRINFENLSSASAPAQLIRIVNDLPPPLDIRTVRLKEIGFKQNRIVVPDNQAFVQQRIQLGADLGNLKADILAGVDLVGNRIFWSLQAIDPQTSEPPLDPFAGLLPPNNAEHDGEGYVIFTVEARPNFPNRTAIENFATIVFDQNEPIVTNTATNLLDSVVPVSQIAPLPLTSDTPDFNLSWTSNDDADGSGYEGTRLLFSENGQPYSLFASSVASAATFTGRWGKTYRFYSLGYDNAGNGELPPTLPDATTTVLGGDTEADLAPRPNGNDGQLNGDDVDQVRRFIAKLDTILQYNEFQRADTAPRADGGNGALSLTDVIQARRYTAGLDTKREAAGPNEALPFSPKSVVGKRSAAGSPRELRPVAVSRIGDVLTLAVELEAQGDETGASFTLEYDTAVLSNPTNVTLGAGAGNAVLTVNSSQTAQGRLGIVMDKAPNDAYPAGLRQLVWMTFTIAPNGPPTTNIGFGNSPVLQEVADGAANSLTTAFTARTLALVGPTAAEVSVGGRIVTSRGVGIRGVTVTITDAAGNSRSARSSTFGYYRFDAVAAGQTYVMSAVSKKYQFSNRVITVSDALDDIDFVPLEE
ncbi:MAG: CARDB domain-containing protein [Pyrinomonadaceae bacterium]